MKSKFSGEFTLSIEDDTGQGHTWIGSLTIPEDKSKDLSFRLFSQNPPFSRAPFRSLESQADTVVRGWINSHRPITLIEPFTTYTGSGALSAGYRSSAEIRGAASNYVEDEHFLGGEAQEISEVGFQSESLDLICRTQVDKTDAQKLDAHPNETEALIQTVSLKGIGELSLSIIFGPRPDGTSEFRRSFTRLRNPDRVRIKDVIKFSHFQLTLLDFLSGKPTGDYHYGILGGRGRDSTLRIACRKREELDLSHPQTRTVMNTPIKQLPELISLVWHNDNIQENMMAATTLVGANLGLIERFSRTTAYLERWLSKRYGNRALKLRQDAYKAQIQAYQDFIRSGGPEIVDFAERFARPAYPRELNLRELLELATEECTPLGLTVEKGYEGELARLRNEVFHGHEGGSTEWIKKIQFAVEVGTAILELLTAKDMGLLPPNSFRPRRDILGTQLGIFG